MSDSSTNAHALDIRNLSITLGGHAILKHVSLDVSPGEIVGFIGENGSGKSTTMKAIASLILPEPGTVYVAGHDVRTETREALDCLSVQIEDPVFFENLTGRDNLTLFTELRGIKPEIAFTLLDDFGLANAGNRKVKRYSLGMRKRLALCIALAYEADLYVLDEPFSGMDLQGMSVFSGHLKALRERGSAVLISSHQLTELRQVMDRAVYIQNGYRVEKEASVYAGA